LDRERERESIAMGGDDNSETKDEPVTTEETSGEGAATVKKEGEEEADAGKEENGGEESVVNDDADDAKKDEEMKDAKKEEGEPEVDPKKEDAGNDDDDDDNNAAKETKGKRKSRSSAAPKEENQEQSPLKRERRERKSADVFRPDDFVHVDKSLQVQEGRGAPLGDLPACRESIEQCPDGELLVAHCLVFPTRGKPAKKDLKANLLAFSGYLPVKKDGTDKKEKDAIDEECEVRRGYKRILLFVRAC
jgi:hypothetical protein